MKRGDRVLVADDEPLSREFLQEALTAYGCEVHAVADGTAAIAALGQSEFDVVVTDLRMPGPDGIKVLEAAKRCDPALPVLLVTAHGTMHVAVEAMRKGADDILEKPIALEELELAMQRVGQRRRLLRENGYLRTQGVDGELIVASPAMERVLALVERVATSNAAVLVRGESGTGKERIATMLHQRSHRASGPFIKLNCAALPENLLESELFGHEAGAFTGASRRHCGRFELADGGTLFLDEVGEMSPAMQAKLLRVLQEGEFERVGGSRTIKVDVRIVAATNRDLTQAVASGAFRADLLFRLDVLPLVLPPLRERPQEIVPLARHFLPTGCTLDEGAARALGAWHWPGNVRELQNVMQRLALLCEDGLVTAALVQRWLLPTADASSCEPIVELSPQDPFQALVGKTLQEIEQEVVCRTLARFSGNRGKTAAALGIGVRTLFNKLQAGRGVV